MSRTAECAIRGDTISVLTRAIKKHGFLAKVWSGAFA